MIGKFTLSGYAQIAEIVAAVAVVISLVYVGIGLRDNTSAVRSASVQAITNTSLDALSVQAASAELSLIRLVGDDEYSSLTEHEKYRYYLMYRQVWLTFQNVFLQRELGVISPEIWGTYERIICTNIEKPGARNTWNVHASVLEATFVALVEACPNF